MPSLSSPATGNSGLKFLGCESHDVERVWVSEVPHGPKLSSHQDVYVTWSKNKQLLC